jgi:hypothetical protein
MDVFDSPLASYRGLSSDHVRVRLGEEHDFRMKRVVLVVHDQIAAAVTADVQHRSQLDSPLPARDRDTTEVGHE